MKKKEKLNVLKEKMKYKYVIKIFKNFTCIYWKFKFYENFASLTNVMTSFYDN